MRQQIDVRLDIIDDSEFSKTMWSRYVLDRLDGIESRERSLATDPVARGRDREQFPGFYAWADANATLFGYVEDSNFLPPYGHATRGRRATPLPHPGRRA